MPIPGEIQWRWNAVPKNRVITADQRSRYRSSFRLMQPVSDVCDRWRGPNGLDNFIADMPIPADISRFQIRLGQIDHAAGYSPENCRWERVAPQNKPRDPMSGRERDRLARLEFHHRMMQPVSTVCDRWRWARGFEFFVLDMGPRPPHARLVQIDSAAGYSPENCRWETMADRAKANRAKATAKNPRPPPVEFTYKGVTGNIAKLVALFAVDDSISKATVYSRLRIGWTLERALRTPNQHKPYKP